jgi:hypothetical protein
LEGPLEGLRGDYEREGEGTGSRAGTKTEEENRDQRQGAQVSAEISNNWWPVISIVSIPY